MNNFNNFQKAIDLKEIGSNDTILATSNRFLHHLIVNKLQKFI